MRSLNTQLNIKYLIEHWEEYKVYYAGVSEANANAVLFDPKKGKKSITLHEWWLPVTDRIQLNQITGFMQLNPIEPDTYGVMGPDNTLYGYLHTTVKHVTIKVIDGSTLWIDDLSTIQENYQPVLVSP